MERSHEDRDAILDAATDTVINDGIAALSFRAVQARTGLDEAAVLAAFPALELLMTAMLEREFSRVRRMIIDNIERDPRGGLLSRIHRYALTAVYESPLSRALYLDDPESLNRIMRSTDGMRTGPRIGPSVDLIEQMKEAGMVRADVDSAALAAVLEVVLAGAALSAPRGGIDRSTLGLTMLLERGVDADVVDTSPGKAVYIAYAARR